MGAKAFSMGYSSILGVVIFEQTIGAILAGVAASLIVSFVATFILYKMVMNCNVKFFQEKTEWEGNEIYSVVDGRLKKLEKVADPAFAQKMLGDGAAIDPQNELIVAPCEGTITMMYPTLHAFGITNTDGVEILVHIGIDTVRLKGKGFTKYVEQGSHVRPGDKIISFDPRYLHDEDLDLTIMVLFPGLDREMNIIQSGYVRRGKDPIATYQ